MTKSPPIKSTQELRKISTAYFKDLEASSNDPNQKIAWCSSVGPAELLLAMGFKVYYPENHTAMLGTSRLANKYIPAAIAQGYAPEICSYLTSDIGAFLHGETPFTKAYGLKEVPKPDVLAFNTNQCRDIQDWFSWYSKRLNVPIVGINSPSFVNEMKENHILSVVTQLKDMIPVLEKIIDQSFEKKKLEHTVNLSYQCSEIWQEVLETAKTIPSPITFWDSCFQMLPAVVLRGSQTAVDYYKMLKQELIERIEKTEAAVLNEKFRIYWEGMPIWGKIRSLSEQLYDSQTSVVASTYCSSWVFSDLGSSTNEPFTNMAKAYTKLFINRSESSKEDYLIQKFKSFNIDGVIYHNARTCPNNSNTNYGMPKRLENQLNIPSIVIDADLNDLNVYSEEQTRTKIDAFVEQLAGV